MTRSEKVVNFFCKNAFLSLWTMASPIGKKDGKELCDAIVVFEEDIIIISVKEISYRPTPDIETGQNRWLKSAIEKSVKQLKGAARHIESVDSITSKNKNVSLRLPSKESRHYRFITISLGADRKIPVSIPMIDNQIIHFIDEHSIDAIFRELDTINDFIEYLNAKEKMLASSGKIIIGSEESLLSYFIFNQRSFPENADLLILGDDLWPELKSRQEYHAKKQADRVSYFWDSIIEEFINMRDPELKSILGYFDTSNENTELALRELAKENRFSRRILSQAFFEFHADKKIASRMVESSSGVYYIFLKKPKSIPRDLRQIELLARSYIIRDRIGRDVKIVAMATEDDISLGHSFDLLYFQKSLWTDEDHKTAIKAMKDLDLFVNPREGRISADEFPREE